MDQSMLAAYFKGPLKLSLEKTEIPQLIPGSALLKIKSCALCGSDIRTFFHGNERIPTPQILGHEISGEIVALSKEVKSLQVGDRISLAADIPCEDCPFCKKGLSNCCKENLAVGYQIPGGFAQYMLLPPRLIETGPWMKFSPNLSFDLACLAEPLACCLNGLSKLNLKKEHSLLIFGAGPIGIIFAMLAKNMGITKIFMADPKDIRLQQAGKILKTAQLLKTDVKKQVLEMTEGIGVDRIVTACPDLSCHELSFDIISNAGVINFFGGLPKDSSPLTISSNFLHYNEVTITGSHGCTPKQHKQAVKMLEKGEIDLSPLITHRFSLEEIHKAFEVAEEKMGLKVLIRI